MPAPRTLYPILTRPILPPVVASTPTIDRWNGSGLPPQRTWGDAARSSTAALYAGGAAVDILIGPTFPEVIRADKWLGYQPPRVDDLKRQQSTYPSLATDARSLTESEAVTLDKWRGHRPERIDDLRRQQYAYPSFFTDSLSLTAKETVRADKWLGYQPSRLDDLRRAQFSYPWSFIDSTALTRAETTTPDKWQPEMQRPPNDLKRQQYAYPVRADPTFGFGLAIPQPDKWLGQRPDVLFDLKRLQYSYPIQAFRSLTAGANFPEITRADKWQPEMQRPPNDLKRQQYGYPSVFVVNDQWKILIQQYDRWAPRYPDWLPDTRARPSLYLPWVIDPRALIPIIVIPPPPIVLSILSVTPSLGPYVGGQRIIVRGSAFLGGTTVTIGGTPCTNVSLASSTTLTALTGARVGPSGTFDVVVRDSLGNMVSLAAAYTYQPPDAPPPITPLDPMSITPLYFVEPFPDDEDDPRTWKPPRRRWRH